MSRKFFISAFLMILGGILLWADPLENVCTALAARPNTTGDFLQIKTISSNGRQLKSTGSFIISKMGIMWKTEKPFPSALILTEDSMIQIAANGTKTVMSGSDNQIFANISNTLSSVFSGDVKALKANFDCDFTAANENWTVRLKPKDSTIASVMTELVMSGNLSKDGAFASLDYLEMFEASNNTIRYEFTNQKYPEELSADEKQNFIIN
jgi:hypothetical protein